MAEKVSIMSCELNREKLQDWFDKPGTPTLPPDVGEHVKNCADCRTFATQWNRIELQLQAMKEEGPAPSPDFTEGLRARLAEPKPRFRMSLPVYTLRLATAGVTAVLALVAAIYLLSALNIISPLDSITAIIHPWSSSGAGK